MDKKLAGVGLVNLIVIAVFVMLMIVGSKVVLNQYPVSGLTEMVNSI